MPATADASLKVYRLHGNGVTMRAGSTWRQVQRRDNVTMTDLLHIPEGCAVELLDSGTRRIYSSTSTGDMSVESLIAEAINDASAITARTNRKILASVIENAASTRKRYGGAGLSMHDTDAGFETAVISEPGESYLLHLMRLSPDEPYNDRNDIILIRRDYDDNDDSFNFAAFNTLDTPLYINVIDQSDSGEINLYFEENPLIAPKSETLVGQYRFILPEEPTGYIAIASDKPFTADDVRALVNNEEPPSGGSFIFSLLRI